MPTFPAGVSAPSLGLIPYIPAVLRNDPGCKLLRILTEAYRADAKNGQSAGGWALGSLGSAPGSAVKLQSNLIQGGDPLG